MSTHRPGERHGRPSPPDWRPPWRGGRPSLKTPPAGQSAGFARQRAVRRGLVRSAQALAAAALLALALPATAEAQTTDPAGTLDEGDNAASETVTPTTPSGGICARTDQVRDAIVARIQAARDCTQVTAAHLASLRGRLKLAGKGIGSLKAGDFAGLSKLREIWLENNQLTTLPPGLFDGLSAVEILQLNGNHLVGLPVGAFDGLSALWLLHLHDNRLSGLPAGVFDGLTSLQQLLLVDNRLSRLPGGVFDGLSDLTDLDLEESGLSSLPAGVFDGLSSLQRLNLEYNQLGDLPADVFDGLSSLTELTLKGNRLSHLPEDVFDGLGSLNWLRLDQNQLTSLPADVFDGLSSLSDLFLSVNRLTSSGLPADVFDGLSSLRRLQLVGNQLTTLPDGLFEGLSALRFLEVQDNSVDPMVVTVSLEKVGDNEFKATAPAGAPFTMTLPVSVANGSIDGGATTIGIPAGAVESGPLAVIRMAGTTAPVTADIGVPLPAPPRPNAGFELARAAGLPREILPERLPALSVADARAREGEDSALVFVVTLDRAAPGTVTVSYATADGTAAAGEDYEAASGALAFAAGETEKSVEVTVLEDLHDEGEETLAFALSGASGATIADGEATGTVAPPRGICARTVEVRDAIVAQIEAARDCTQITAAHLASLGGRLKLAGQGIGSLKAGDFAGLSKLREIWLENNQLTTLPPGLFDGLSAVEILQLNGNHLAGLPVGAFDGLSAVWLLHLHDNRLSGLPVGVFDGLTSLQQLLLVDNRLSRLPAGVFDGLSDLTDLDLEESGLSRLPSGVFDGLSSLQRLNLEYNQLSDLPADVFDGLSSLTELTLKGNRLSNLPEDVFDGLGSLNRLRLDQNQLTSVPADVFDGLDSLAELFLHLNRLTSAGLPADVFDGLDSLYRLQLRGNQLTTLPDGVFEGLSALEFLEVKDNSVNPMVLTVSLERVGNNGFKATAPAGAPFAMTLPVSVANGSIDGGATTIGIPAGAVESGALTVTRTAGTMAAVTADIGLSLPAPPHFHNGYELARATGLPREILPERIPALSVAGARATEGGDSALVFVVTLDRASSPTVTVSYATADGTAAAGEDYEAVSGTLAFAAGETEKTVSVRTTDDSMNEEDETFTLTLSSPANATLGDAVATGTIADDDEPPLTASFSGLPEAHDGESAFHFRVAFSEEIGIGFRSMRDDSFTVDGGEVTAARRVEGRHDLWRITVEPDSDPDVTITLPSARECAVSGAICTRGENRRQLSNSPSATVAGPADEPETNTAAAGAPTISGTPQVGEALTASTSDISDADGLDNARFAYQWIRTGADIGGATGATYTPVAADEGTRLKVRVRFTDDAGHAESLTSAATDAVAAASEPLTASFEGLPAEHAGQGAFSFRVAFSDGISISYKTLRDASFTVTGGDVTRARRVDRRRDLWKITVEPDADEAVTVRLPETTDCDASGAICTGDGRGLSHSLSATVAGPVGITVADARVDENGGARLAFALTLDRAASGTVTVDYATANGSAQAGTDYTATSGTLTFNAGERSKTIDVTVLDDDHDEGEETLTLRLSNASGARIADGSATGTIENTDPLPRGLMARFGRAVAVQVVEHVEERLQAPREPGFRGQVAGLQVRPGMERDLALDFLRQLGGTAGAHPVGAGVHDPITGASTVGAASLQTPGLADGAGIAALPDGALNRGGFPGLGLGGDMLTGSAFTLDRETGTGGVFSVWGRGARSHFMGREGPLSLNGDVRTTMVGADYAKGPLVTGLSLAHSRGRGGYDGAGIGAVASSVTGIYPWLGYKATDRVTVWGVTGYGKGALRLTPEGASALESCLSMAMVAAGTRGELLGDGGTDGFGLAFKADALWVGTSSEGIEGPGGNLAATEAAVTRFRTGLEGSRGFTFSGLALRPSVEVGLRHDGGDAETGAGMDMGGGLVVSHPLLGLSADVRVRMLLVHQAEGFSDRGVSMAFSFDPTPSTPLGFMAKLTPSWGGQAESGAEALWGRDTMTGMANRGHATGGSLAADLSYGMAVGSRLVGTPRIGIGTSEYGRDYRFGYGLSVLQGGAMSFELGLDGQRRESPSANGADHAIVARFTARW